MNFFDIALLLIIAIFSAIGVWRGFVRELISFITWIAACFAAWTLSDRIAPMFESLTREQELRQMAAFVSVFLVVFITGAVIGALLHKVVSRSDSLRRANRVTGGMVGCLRGFAIIVIVFMLAGLTSFPQREWWRDAVLSPPFERIAAYAARYLPPDVARHVRYS